MIQMSELVHSKSKERNQNLKVLTVLGLDSLWGAAKESVLLDDDID